MTTWPLSRSLLLGPPRTAQIQSITDESRSSIRRKNQGAAQGASLSRQSSLMEDNQEDEVADFFCDPRPVPSPPAVHHCQTHGLVFTKLDRFECLDSENYLFVRQIPFWLYSEKFVESLMV